jgi:hypothetical protein
VQELPTIQHHINRISCHSQRFSPNKVTIRVYLKHLYRTVLLSDTSQVPVRTQADPTLDVCVVNLTPQEKVDKICHPL